MQIRTIVPRHIITVTDLLSPRECAELIDRSEDLGYRSSARPCSDRDDKVPLPWTPDLLDMELPVLTDQLWRRVRLAVPEVLGGWAAEGLSGRFRLYRQKPGQLLRDHKDIPFQEASSCSRMTLLCYLNQDFRGGGTSLRGVAVRPRTGMAVLLRHELSRTALRITWGRKYVLRTEVMFRALPTLELPTGAGRVPPPELVEGRRP
ncbi:MAG: hypothetical protein VX498_09705 [Myxococcota bacterium]|nr:hypothetical protein [Myxococcota bacterium]